MMRRSMILGPTVLVTLIAILGCGSPPAGPGMSDDPEIAMDALESCLRDAISVGFATTARAEGVVTAELAGTATWSDAAVAIAADGTFIEKPADLHLTLVDGTLSGGNGTHEFESALPTELREALVLGMTRMGILHNLARLAGALPPDHADGGAAGWLTYEAARWGEETEIDGQPARPLDFTVLVDGAPVAEARLWLRTDDGLPVRREQTVRFPQGDMVVVETYADWEIELGP
jgi:hypothetical protein